jgi:poly-gamma-glutamate synthesis protein (capsule biosynthesis protein)
VRAALLACALLAAPAPGVSPALSPEVWARLLAEPGVTAAPPETLGVVLPHHYVAGQVLSQVYRGLAAQPPDVVVIVSPNHFGAGAEAVLTTTEALPVFDGTHVAVAREDALALAHDGLLGVEPAPFGREHGVGLHAQYLAHFLPAAVALPLVVKDGASLAHLDRLAEALVQRLGARKWLVVLSMDASHENAQLAADLHDQKTLNVLAHLDLDATAGVETDTDAGLRLFLRLMQLRGAQRAQVLAHTNSQQWTPDPVAATTSHLFVAFSRGPAVATPAVATFQFFGDALLDRGLERVPPPKASCPPKDPDAHFHAILEDLQAPERRFFRGTDCNVVNLEGTLAADGPVQPGKRVLTQDERMPDVLRSYGFCAAGLANNHALDHFRAGLERTRQVLASEHVTAFGDPSARQPGCTVIERAGVRVGLCGFDDVEAVLDVEAALAQVRALAPRVDFSAVQMHWGQEFQPEPSERQRALARRLVDSGADVVVGSHPHVVQTAELYRGRPIVYSLGNFVFADARPTAPWGGLSVGVAFERAADVRRLTLYFFPLAQVAGKSRLAPAAAQAALLEKLRAGLGAAWSGIPGKLVLSPLK